MYPKSVICDEGCAAGMGDLRSGPLWKQRASSHTSQKSMIGVENDYRVTFLDVLGHK